jgi:hypothetical protein
MKENSSPIRKNYRIFDICIFLGLVIAWMQLIYGLTNHAFFSLGLMITVIFMKIASYLQMIYMDK